MLHQKIIEELSTRFSELLAHTPAKDLEKNAKVMLGAFFEKMDLVTREEYDIQQQVLLKTREKLETLEARVAALERPEPPVTPAA